VLDSCSMMSCRRLLQLMGPGSVSAHSACALWWCHHQCQTPGMTAADVMTSLTFGRAIATKAVCLH
jgi:hypothetical protein